MIKIKKEKRVLYIVLFALFVMFLILSVFSEGTYDPGDGIRHYLVSKYSWQHPDLLLYSWGKPFFTIISSPFSQFGLLGVNIFNIICAIASAFFCFKIAKKLNIEYPFLVIPFLCFTPSYFPTINSGLTEPLFGLVLIASIYLMLENKYAWACILVSFLPYVRTEGMLILPLFFIVMIYRKKFLLSLLLSFGTVLYSIAGYFHYHDILWIINQNPYDGKNKSFYGQGELLHFVKNYNFVWGTFLTILFVVGCVAILYHTFLKIKSTEKKEKLSSLINEENFLIVGSFCIYFVAHSIMWWKGLANSLGLLRVLAGVIPCSAIICLRGFNLLMIPFFKKYKYIEISIIALSLIIVIRSPFKHDYFPYKLDPEQALIKEAGEWYKSQPFQGKKVYYLYPYLAHVLNVDSFDPEKIGELWGLYPTIKQWGITAIPDSTIVFWDAHFGPNECHIPLDTMLNDPNFELIKTFKPKEEFTTLGGYKFEVYVFRKLNKPAKMEEISSDLFDLEQENSAIENTPSISNEKAFSGKSAGKLSEKIEYSVTFKKKLSELPKNTKLINFSMNISDPSMHSKDALIVLSIDDLSGKNLFWDGKPIVPTSENEYKEWKNCETHYNVNLGSYPPTSTLKVYVWNKSKKVFYIDDFKISYWGKE